MLVIDSPTLVAPVDAIVKSCLNTGKGDDDEIAGWCEDEERRSVVRWREEQEREGVEIRRDEVKIGEDEEDKAGGKRDEGGAARGGSEGSSKGRIREKSGEDKVESRGKREGDEDKVGKERSEGQSASCSAMRENVEKVLTVFVVVVKVSECERGSCGSEEKGREREENGSEVGKPVGSRTQRNKAKFHTSFFVLPCSLSFSLLLFHALHPCTAFCSLDKRSYDLINSVLQLCPNLSSARSSPYCEP